MRIGFYLDYANMQAGGIFTYSIGVLKDLLNSKKIGKIVLFYFSEQRDKLQAIISEPKIEAVELKRNNFFFKYFSIISFFLYTATFTYKTYFDKYFPNSKIPLQIRKIAVFINPFRKIFYNSKIELLHIPFKIAPIYNLKIPVIITMHDVQELHFPEFFTAQQRLDRALMYKIAIEQADKIIVSFNHVSEDIIKYFHVNSSKIQICRLPLDNSWFLENNFTSKKELIEKYNLNENFILYPAATWKHKNHKTLIEAMKLLNEHNNDIQLVCTGHQNDNYLALKKLIEDYQLQYKVVFLGVVPEADLIGLYKSTKLCVIPTLYEAGSGPLFEAMRYESPVICSNVTSLPETINNKEFVFNPLDSLALSILIEKGISDIEWQRRNIQNSKNRMKYFKTELSNNDFENLYMSIKKIN